MPGMILIQSTEPFLGCAFMRAGANGAPNTWQDPTDLGWKPFSPSFVKLFQGPLPAPNDQLRAFQVPDSATDCVAVVYATDVNGVPGVMRGLVTVPPPEAPLSSFQGVFVKF
jgi:hypothetical protein